MYEFQSVYDLIFTFLRWAFIGFVLVWVAIERAGGIAAVVYDPGEVVEALRLGYEIHPLFEGNRS